MLHCKHVTLLFRIEHITGCHAYGPPCTVQPSTGVHVLQPDELFNLPPEAQLEPTQQVQLVGMTRIVQLPYCYISAMCSSTICAVRTACDHMSITTTRDHRCSEAALLHHNWHQYNTTAACIFSCSSCKTLLAAGILVAPEDLHLYLFSCTWTRHNTIPPQLVEGIQCQAPVAHQVKPINPLHVPQQVELIPWYHVGHCIACSMPYIASEHEGKLHVVSEASGVELCTLHSITSTSPPG